MRQRNRSAGGQRRGSVLARTSCPRSDRRSVPGAQSDLDPSIRSDELLEECRIRRGVV